MLVFRVRAFCCVFFHFYRIIWTFCDRDSVFASFSIKNPKILKELVESELMNPYQTASNNNTQISPNTSTALSSVNGSLSTPYNDPTTAALVANPTAYNLAMEHPQLYGFSAAGSADINPYYWPNGLPNSIPNPYPAALPTMQGYVFKKLEFNNFLKFLAIQTVLCRRVKTSRPSIRQLAQMQ